MTDTIIKILKDILTNHMSLHFQYNQHYRNMYDFQWYWYKQHENHIHLTPQNIHQCLPKELFHTTYTFMQFVLRYTCTVYSVATKS